MRRLKSFEEARRRVGALNRLPPRVAPVAVRCLVGGVDRAKLAGLRPDFLPRRHGAQASRYRSVYTAMRTGAPLPAIEVYGLGGAYYVVDGHHRVAAARALGHLYIDALVHEFLVPNARVGIVAHNERLPAIRSGESPCATSGRTLDWLTRGVRVGARRHRPD